MYQVLSPSRLQYGFQGALGVTLRTTVHFKVRHREQCQQPWQGRVGATVGDG